MAKIFEDIRVSIEVASGTDECDEYTPPAGSTVGIKAFVGSAAYTQNSACILIWDFGGAGEEILWSIKGSETMQNNACRVIEAGETDGIKKIAICASNGEAGPLVMSAYARLSVELP